MKITKVEKYGKYYENLVDENERKRQKALIGSIASLGGATLLAGLSANNIINAGNADFLTVARDVVLSLATAYSGLLVNASFTELTNREGKKKDYQTLTHCLKTNDGEMMVEFLQSKYPGLYTAIENNIKNQMIEGKTR